MFEDCNSLGELNAKRIQLAATGNLVDVNNAYNKRRQELVAARNQFKKISPIFVQPRPVQQIMGIPIAGRSKELNTTQLSAEGFLY